MSKNQILTIDRLRELVNYNPETGTLTRRVSISNRSKVGEVMGSKCKEKYLLVTVDGRRYLAHRIAWFHYYGDWPVGLVDHKNEIRDDNRITNLRDTDKPGNGHNVTGKRLGVSGYRGVSLNRKLGKWRARLKTNGKEIYLGNFDDPKDAHIAYLNGKHKYQSVPEDKFLSAFAEHAAREADARLIAASNAEAV